MTKDSSCGQWHSIKKGEGESEGEIKEWGGTRGGQLEVSFRSVLPSTLHLISLPKHPI